MFTALLPMKANSERVPGKNFKRLGHKPLFRWILDSLLDCEGISRVVINTDAREHLDVCGIPDDSRVVIRDRPNDICGDFVSMNKVIKSDLEVYGPGHYLMTHTTNPFLSAATIERALEIYSENIHTQDSLFTVNTHQTRFYDRAVRPINHDPDNLIRTQDLEPYYEENSCLYLFSFDSFAASGARIGLKPNMFPMAKLEAIDIDDQEDWDFAAALAEVKKESVLS